MLKGISVLTTYSIYVNRRVVFRADISCLYPVFGKKKPVDVERWLDGQTVCNPRGGRYLDGGTLAFLSALNRPAASTKLANYLCRVR